MDEQNAPISIAQLKDLARDGGGHRAEVRAQIERAGTKTTKAGKPYLDWLVRDADDSLSLKVWEDDASYRAATESKPGDFLAVLGTWRVGSYGLESPDWNFRVLTDEEIGLLMSAGGTFALQQAEDYAYIEAQVAGLEDPRLLAICTAFLERFGEQFRRTAAARDYHHARRGGLVEHVAQMMRSANALSGAYAQVNRSLLLAGVLFHDCGKLWENCLPKRGFNMPFTEFAELLGHIPTGMELVNKLWREAEASAGDWWTEGDPKPGLVRLHLLHLIASHHGEYAFGSPTVPKTPEAQLLHYIDNIDAKMEMFRRGYAGANLLGKRVFQRVRPLPGNLVEPLPDYEGGPKTSEEAAPEVVEEAVASEPDAVAPMPIPESADEVAPAAEETGDRNVPAPSEVAEAPPAPRDDEDDVGF